MRRALITLACVIGVLAAAVPIAGAVGFLHLYRIPSSSMEPTFHCARPALLCRASTSDRVVVLRYVGVSPKRGQIIAFHATPRARAACGLQPGAVLIKRIARIRDGRYFLLGDNRGASCDSRVWGAIPRSRVIGRVVATYWPWGRIRSH
jgi:signal peptidase I